MHARRAGVDVPAAVVVLLGVLAERVNQQTGIARPGYDTLMLDTGFSKDTIARAVAGARILGALAPNPREYQGRGLAVEFRFTDAVYAAPNLDAFAEADRDRKGRTTAGFSPSEKAASVRTLSAEKAANRPAKRPQIARLKGRKDAAPTVSTTVGTTGSPPAAAPRRPTPSSAIEPEVVKHGGRSARHRGDSWLTPYGEAWKARWGGASEPPWGEMAKAIKVAEERLGREEALRRWTFYLATERDVRYTRGATFLKGLDQWLPGATGNGGQLSPAAATAANFERLMGRRG
jgi:hypothetical protein